LKEREEFYKEEFDLDGVEGWLENVIQHTVFAVIIGGIRKFIPESIERTPLQRSS